MNFMLSNKSKSTTGEKRGSFSRPALLISGVIVFFLVFQGLATFRVLCPPENIKSLSFLRVGCPPTLWPFIDYPMYFVPHYEGEKIPQLKVVGTLVDGTNVEIQAEDLHLTFWLYQDFLQAVDQGDPEVLHNYVELYQNYHGVELASLRLENNPIVISRDGMKSGTPGVVREIDLDR